MDEGKEHKETSMIKDLFHQLQERREDEDEARGPIEEMQRNLDEAHGNWTEYFGNTLKLLTKK